MISPTTRRSAIPIPSAAAASASSAGRRLTPASRSALSRSRDTLLDPASVNSSGVAVDTDRELHAFTLLEENIALKERLEQLLAQHQQHSADQQQQLLVAHSQLTAQRAECERAQQAEAAVRVQLQQTERTAEHRQRTEVSAAVQRESLAGRQQLDLQRQQHETWAAAVRQQQASVELQLYEANEKIAELVEESGRQGAETTCVTSIARALVASGCCGGVGGDGGVRMDNR